jgi:plasmid stabilization system protein ParE
MAHKLTYRPRASEDLEAIYRIIAQDKPASALGFIEKIRRRCDLLRIFYGGQDYEAIMSGDGEAE